MADIRPGAALEWENHVVLQLIQAMLGLVTPSIRGIAVEFDGENVVVHFAVSERTEALLEDVDDVIGGLEGGLWPNTPQVSSSVYVGSPGNDAGWMGRQHRLVYLAKQ